MGGAVSKRHVKVLSPQERIQYIKKSPFYLFLHDETLQEFGYCFPFLLRVKEGDIVNLDRNKVYIVAEGELELRTTLPEPKGKIESKGYLCKKRPGDIISKPCENEIVVEKVRDQ
jgi:hypothetical protein